MKKVFFLFAALFLIGLSHASAQSTSASAQRGVSAVVTDTSRATTEAGSSSPVLNTTQRNSQQAIAPGTYPAGTRETGQSSATKKEEPATVEPH